MNIEDGKVVSIHYTLKHDDGSTIDTSAGGDPLVYLHGAQNIVPGLEQALAGKTSGDNVKVTVPPELGYGEKIDHQQVVNRSEFPDDVELSAGMALRTRDEQGNVGVIWIDEIQGDHVMISENHPLAGLNLHFEIDVVNVREASDEERSSGRPL